MKNLVRVLLITLGVMFVSCDANNKYKCRQSITEMFPNAVDVKMLPSDPFKWMVLNNDSTVWFVETMNITNPDVSDFEKVFDINSYKY